MVTEQVTIQMEILIKLIDFTMVNIKLLMRLEQICSSLQKEGWIFISNQHYPGELQQSVFYRHPNTSRIVIDVYEEYLLIFKNKKLVKREHVPLASAATPPT